MHISAQSLWLPRIFSFVLAALVAGSVAFWGLQMSAPAGAATVTAVDTTAAAPADTAAVARALGGAGSAAASAAVSPVQASSRFVLTGVVASQSKAGACLIAVDGQPAKSFVVGARVGNDWVLRSVQARRAVLVQADANGQVPATGGAEMVLELPPPAPLLALGKPKNSP